MTQEIKKAVPPKMTDVLSDLKKDIFKNLNCVKIGQIVSFDTSDQTASVQIAFKQVQNINADGTKVLKDYPVLAKCPCVVIGGGTASLQMPIKAGDFAVVLFNDRDIDNWWRAGINQEPNTPRLHSISDGIVLVGLNNMISALSNYMADRVKLKFQDSDQIELKNGEIDILTTLLKITANITMTGDMNVTGKITATGQVEGGTLKADNGITGTVYVAPSSGASPTVPITFTNGIRTA